MDPFLGSSRCYKSYTIMQSVQLSMFPSVSLFRAYLHIKVDTMLLPPGICRLRHLAGQPIPVLGQSFVTDAVLSCCGSILVSACCQDTLLACIGDAALDELHTSGTTIGSNTCNHRAVCLTCCERPARLVVHECLVTLSCSLKHQQSRGKP